MVFFAGLIVEHRIVVKDAIDGLELAILSHLDGSPCTVRRITRILIPCQVALEDRIGDQQCPGGVKIDSAAAVTIPARRRFIVDQDAVQHRHRFCRVDPATRMVVTRGRGGDAIGNDTTLNRQPCSGVVDAGSETT